MTRIEVTLNNGYTYTYVVDKHISKVESGIKEAFENKKYYLISEEREKMFINLNNCFNVKLINI